MTEVVHGAKSTLAGTPQPQTNSTGPVEIPDGFELFRKVSLIYAQRQDEPFVIETPEGVMTASAGDYLCMDPVDGHAWPVKAEYFDKNYVAVERTIS